MIYAINKTTKEHVANPVMSEIGLIKDWDVVNATNDGWIKHDGGECPLPKGARCDVQFSDGAVASSVKDGDEGIDSVGDEFLITFQPDQNDINPIVAYRPILNSKEEEMSKEWDGEGLPPVGTVCEMISSDERTVKVLAYGKHGGDDAALVCETYQGVDDQMSGVLCKHVEFRPIRSAEDKAVDEMAKIIMDVPEDRDDRQDSTNIARALYRAGYRKTGDKS